MTTTTPAAPAALYVLDSYALIYRSYFAFISRPLTNQKGENVSAVFGFFRNLKAAFDHYNPAFFAAAFDSIGPTFRHELYSDYKATRQKTPEDLHAQIPVIEEILIALGIPVIRRNGFEADDIIATLASRCEAEGRRCRILTGDKDLMQLVSANVDILRPDKAGGWEALGAEGVKAEWGVPPAKMLDLLSLTGDSADNVPGVSGIGPKTALKLLETYGSLEGVYEHAEEITGAVGEKIRAGRESAFSSRALIVLKDDVVLPEGLARFSTQNLDYAAAADALSAHGLPSVAKQYAATSSQGLSSAPDETASSADTPSKDPAKSAEADVQTYTKNAGEYRGITELGELRSCIDEILAQKPIEAAFDLETDRLDTHTAALVGFSLSREKGTGVYVPVISPDSLMTGPVIPKADALREIWRLFGNPQCTLALHNGKFDYEVLRANGMEKPRCVIFDTMVASWILEPDRAGYGLEALGLTKLALETISYNQVVPKGATFAEAPLDKAIPYAAEDADLTWQLFQYYRPRLAREKLDRLFYDMEMPLLPVLAEMEIAGIHLEKEELAKYSVELASHIAQSEGEIFELVGHEFNISSPKQLQEVLFVERGLKTGKKTKTGYSTDITVLEDLAAWDPVPRKILEYRTLAKLKSTYVDALPLLADSTGRVHTSFIQTGTATGRLSSRDPNLQNIPVREEEGRRIRKAFTAEPGNTLISADYSQIELVILAHLSGDENLCRAFLSGADVHKATAGLIFGVEAGSVTADMRRAAKTINFGVMYGMSAFRLSNGLGITRTKAQEFLDAYNATYAGVQRYFADTIAKAEETGFVETIFGRRRAISGIASKNKLEKSGAERIAKNTPIQGSAADIVKKAMLAVNAALEQALSPARLLLQVHDELIFECPQAEAEHAAALVKKAMEGVVALRVPLGVSVEAGPRWGDFH
jgi:DNA polymerase-1